MMFSLGFVRHAYLAGTFIALGCGLVGWYVVLRGQVFAGDALSHVAFTGAVAAAALGVDVRIGLFAATILIAVVIAGLGRRAIADDVTIGTVFSWILGLGVFFIALSAGSAIGGQSAVTAADALFGSIFGLSAGGASLAAGIAAAATVALLGIARPLLFATLDPDVARARGVPVAAVGAGFLVLVGVMAAETTQAVGALLLLGLLAGPAGAARQLTTDPWRGLAVSAAIALVAMWGGLALSYHVGSLPPSTAVMGIVAAAYVLALGARRLAHTP